MKKWFQNRSILIKFLSVGWTTILLIALPSFVIMSYFFNNSDRAERILAISDSITSQMLYARVAEKNFVLRDLNSDLFYNSGSSKYLKEHRTFISLAQDEIRNLINLSPKGVQNKAKELMTLVDEYDSIFSKIVATYRKRGFKDWGLLGEWRQAIHAVEGSVSQMNRADIHEDLLQLRRLEKDYLLRQDEKYLEEVTNQLSLLRDKILNLPRQKAKRILKKIDIYENAFKNYILLQKKIGRTDEEGLQKDFIAVIHKMKPVVDNIFTETQAANQKARHEFMIASILIYFFGIGLGSTVLYFFARSISLNLIDLKNAVLHVGKGHLDTKVVINSTDEIGIVADAFNKMTADLDNITVSKNYVDQIIESMADMLIVISPQMTIKTVNRATLELLGYKEAELLGKPVSIILGGFNSDNLFINELARKKFVRTVEKEFVRKDGSKIPVSFSGSPMSSRLGIVCIAHDNTERKRAESILRKSERELRLLSSKTLEAQENERKRVARELHDGIGQALTGIKFTLENGLRKLREKKVIANVKAFDDTIPLIQATVEETRRIAMGLRPSTLDDIGITETIFWFCQQFESIYKTIRIKALIEVEEDRLPESLKTVIFRVLQESLNNVAKHSQADGVHLNLRNKPGAVELVIEDNGIGFDPEKLTLQENIDRGFGLASMKERTELAGGTLSIRSVPDEGTTVQALWPLAEK